MQVPLPLFRSQQAALGPSDLHFAIASSGSKITYAPTNSCNSTTAAYDVNVDGTVASGEGVGTTASLDAPSGSNTVQQELNARGFSLPDWF